MSTVLIETYRNFEILFDKDNERFLVRNLEEDFEKTKQSFASCIKHVDDYCKNNTNFKPFTIFKPLSSFNNTEIKIVLGVRKDNRFIIGDFVGDKPRQLSEYDEKYWFIVDNIEDVQFFTSKLKDIKKEMQHLRSLEKEITEQIKSKFKTLQDYKNA